MQKFPLKLKKRLESRKDQNSFRQLGFEDRLIDFSSNDYLGFSASITISEAVQEILKEKSLLKNGATGSRLLTGNHHLYAAAEEKIRKFHAAEEALIFNSGYDANVGFFATIPQREDLVLFDEYVHASIRDGIGLGNARALKFRHNDLDHLKTMIIRSQKNSPAGNIFIVTESVFSMDGDKPPLGGLVELAGEYDAFLVVDEAHSAFVSGKQGESLVEELGLQDLVFARLITFGKALGCHGAAIVGSRILRDYLINFCRSLIYTTALPPHSVATVLAAYNHLKGDGRRNVKELHSKISFFKQLVQEKKIRDFFLESSSAIHSCIVPGNEEVKKISYALREQGFDVRPILSPTVPAGSERLRFCLHQYNTEAEIESVLSLLVQNLKNE